MKSADEVINELETLMNNGGMPGVIAFHAWELLKKQLKTKVVFMRNGDGYFQTECGNCGTYLDKAYSRCPKCQRELDWNSNQS